MWDYWYFSWQSWFQFVLHPARHFTWCILHVSWISRMTIYRWWLYKSVNVLETINLSLELTLFFTFVKRLFSSLLSAVKGWCHLHIWGYWHFSWQSWFQLVLHPGQHFLMMYSAYKLNKQGDNIQPWCTPFPIWNQSVLPCPFLTVASWPAYRFLKRQARWSGIPISFRIFHSLLWST